MQQQVYSLTQRWSPVATVEEGEDKVRVHFLVLIDENSGECLAKEFTEIALPPIELAAWALEALPPELSRGSKICLDDPNLLGPLSLYLPDFELALATRCEHRDQFFANIAQQLQSFQNEADYSLVESFGETDALRFYGLAKEYFEAAPWLLFGKQTFLEFRDAEAKQHILGIYAPEVEYIGFCFMDPQEYREYRQSKKKVGMPRPVWGLDFGNVAYVAGADLDLLDRKNLNFQPDRSPWILVEDLPDGLTRVLFEDLLWLLRRIPQFAQDQKPIKAEGRRLQLAQVTID